VPYLNKAARAARQREREAAQKAKEDAWKAKVDPHFAFLREQYSFEITQTYWSSWVTRVRYETPLTAVDVERSAEDFRVEVLLIRKVEGEVPKYPIFVTAVDIMHHFRLDEVLEERSPEALAEVRATRGLGEEQIDAGLTISAKALEKYATDILQGDFSLFAKMEAKVRAYLREHPEVITVYVPADTPPERIAQIEREAGDPSGKVPVIVRKYQPPTPNHKKQPSDTEQPRS
jgi:hypothetical protein